MTTTLTVNDPIDADTLASIKILREARRDLAENYLDLELERIQLLAAVRKIDQQSSRIYERCNVERGLSPNTEIDIDPDTGALTVMTPPSKE